MLYDYYSNAIFKNTIDHASDVLGYDCWDIIQNNEKALNQTDYTQPILLAASIAIWNILKDHLSEQPSYFAGHSLGEYSALVAAESISFDDALRLVQKRGQLMQSSMQNINKETAMSAILGLQDNEVIEICKESNFIGIVEPANFNSSGQIVISGEKAAVLHANDLARKKGARRTQMLSVSVPSHCSLMKSAAQDFSKFVNEAAISVGSIPIIHNVDTVSHRTPKAIKQALIRQLYHPVLWSQTIIYLYESRGINNFIECGPGKVLTGLGKRIASSSTHCNTSTLLDLQRIL